MEKTELLSEQIARLLKEKTFEETGIKCEFRQSGMFRFTSEDILEAAGTIGKQIFSKIVLEYHFNKLGKYWAFNPHYEYEHPDNGHNCYSPAVQYYLNTDTAQFARTEEEIEDAWRSIRKFTYGKFTE